MNDKEKECLKEIGQKLTLLRIKNGYKSYESFALENDLSRMQYWRLEKGKTNLTMKTLLKILAIHKVNYADFFCSFGSAHD